MLRLAVSLYTPAAALCENITGAMVAFSTPSCVWYEELDRSITMPRRFNSLTTFCKQNSCQINVNKI